MAKKRTLKINNVLTGKTRDIAVPEIRGESKQAKPKSEGGSNVQRKS